MASFNRSRYEIEIGDRWKEFSEPLPGNNMLGVVRVGNIEGALVRRVATGQFWLARFGCTPRLLLAHKVEAAIDARRAA
ncbi:MAG: hypothetical protein ACJ75S_07100 [Solirubrobacterales bacterium]|jgi:hypothetical protein